MPPQDFDLENLFTSNPFEVDPNLLQRLAMLQNILQVKYGILKLNILQGARTAQSNIEYYQKRYGSSWANYHNKNSLHIISPTNPILRAADISFTTEDGNALSGEDIYLSIKDNYLFSNVGIGENYVHVDTFIRSWHYT